jgi:hypothetical protein
MIFFALSSIKSGFLTCLHVENSLGKLTGQTSPA